jgi:urease accessory protein UreE
MILISRVLGHCDDAFWAGVCERMEQQGLLEMLLVEPEQLRKKQFRATTDKGTVVGVSLHEENVANSISSTLRPGAVVFYEENHRVVLAQIRGARVLVVATLNEFTLEDALTLGHYCGCLGWVMRTRQHPTHIEIFIQCGEEEQMEIAIRNCPLPNISWTLRDRRSTDPLPPTP